MRARPGFFTALKWANSVNAFWFLWRAVASGLLLDWMMAVFLLGMAALTWGLDFAMGRRSRRAAIEAAFWRGRCVVCGRAGMLSGYMGPAGEMVILSTCAEGCLPAAHVVDPARVEEISRELREREGGRE